MWPAIWKFIRIQEEMEKKEYQQKNGTKQKITRLHLDPDGPDPGCRFGREI